MTLMKKSRVCVLTSLLFGGALLAPPMANANIISSLISSLFGFNSDQGDAVSDTVLLVSSQESVSPVIIADSMKDSAKATVAVLSADRIAHSIANATFEGMPKYGFSDGLQCLAYAEKTTTQSKTLMSSDKALQDTLALASQYDYSESSKQASRVAEHLENYCDITEVANGVCMPSFNGLGGADSDYSNISGTNHLSTEEKEAAYAYMRNMVEPTPLNIKGCESIACTKTSDVQRAHNTFASMAHGTFAHQISARTLQDFGNMGTDLNIKMDSEGNLKDNASSNNQEGEEVKNNG